MTDIALDDLLTELITREEAMQSLSAYIEYVSGLKVPPHMKLVCDRLDAVAEGRIKRLMISMPPGHGKSYCASHFFPAYYLAKYPEKQIIAATHKQELSDSFGRKVRNTIMSDDHRRLFPNSSVATDKTAAGEWQTTGAGGYHATAVGANVTGRRGDILIGDDLLSGIQAAESESERNKLWAWYGGGFFHAPEEQGHADSFDRNTLASG